MVLGCIKPMPLSSFQPSLPEAPTTPPDACPRSQPTFKKRIDEAQIEAREGLFRWLIFLLAGGVGLAHFLY